MACSLSTIYCSREQNSPARMGKKFGFEPVRTGLKNGDVTTESLSHGRLEDVFIIAVSWRIAPARTDRACVTVPCNFCQAAVQIISWICPNADSRVCGNTGNEMGLRRPGSAVIAGGYCRCSGIYVLPGIGWSCGEVGDGLPIQQVGRGFKSECRIGGGGNGEAN
jgi:hypothetical protein